MPDEIEEKGLIVITKFWGDIDNERIVMLMVMVKKNHGDNITHQ